MMLAGACMNIQRVDDAVFLSYIAKYITKPEPHGILADTEELRAREKMSDAERFLNCRIVGMPEACHRTWGFHMKAGTNVVHLTTKVPHKRMRAIPRCKDTTKDSDFSDSDSDSMDTDLGITDEEDSEPEETPTELRFLDGVLEHYMNRPVDPDGQDEYWEPMLYPDFHRMYRLMSGKHLGKTDIKFERYRACTNRGKELVNEEEGIIETAMYCVPCVARSNATRPVAADWLLPDKHGDEYYYQQLLMKVPFRSSAPSDLMSPENTTGTLRDECVHRGIIPSEANGGVAALIEADAKKRLFTPEQIESFVEHYKQHEEVMAGRVLTDDAQARVAADLDMDSEDVQRLQDDINSAQNEEPACSMPDIRITTQVVDGAQREVACWHETNDKDSAGTIQKWQLTPSQYESYKLLKTAGDKQLLTFLSGEGGMGKSLLIRLLVQHWRASGKRVLVCASSAKAARLIGGHTVHSAFNLRLNGGFYETQLNGSRKHCEQWAWLYTRDIIIIDEMSMLTAGAFHGVNHALNNVMSLSMSHVSNVTFGGKSILTVGDLFQLPAVERFRFNEQALHRSLMQATANNHPPSSHTYTSHGRSTIQPCGHLSHF